MKPIITAITIIILLGVITKGVKADSIRDYCKSIVGESYSLMETCIKSEEEAKGRLEY